MAVIPRKPYLINALCDWSEDNGWTPLLVVAADRPGVQVPRHLVKDGKITLNVSSQATRDRDIGVNGLHALARFSGEVQRLNVPLDAIDAFMVRETGEGMLFPPEVNEEAEDSVQDDLALSEISSDPEDPEPSPPGAPAGSRRGHLKVVK